MVSSELQELRSISDRIAIVSEGKIVDILSPDASNTAFGLAMSGIKPDEKRKGGRSVKNWRRITAIIMLVAGAALIVIGAVNLPNRKRNGTCHIEKLRVRSLLSAVGDGVVESYVDIAKQQATEEVKAKGGSLSDLRKAIKEAEENVRANYKGTTTDYSSKDMTGVYAALNEYDASLAKYANEKALAEKEYYDAHFAEAEVLAEQKREEALAKGEDVPAEINVTVDMSDFVPTGNMLSLREQIDRKI